MARRNHNRDRAYSEACATEAARIRRVLADDSEFAKSGRAELTALYVFLDVIDRKVSGLMTLNSFLIGLVGLIVIRPLMEQPSSLPFSARLPIAGFYINLPGLAAYIAIAASLLSIGLALAVFRVRWNYFGLVDPVATAEGWERECNHLARETALRTARLRDMRALTLVSAVSSAIAIFSLLF